MSLEFDKRRVLAVLFDNLKSSQVELVSSSSIADILQMKLSETRQVIKVLNDTGEVVSDLDGHYSIITPHGVNWLKQRDTAFL
jgi:hypothetical protein